MASACWGAALGVARCWGAWQDAIALAHPRGLSDKRAPEVFHFRRARFLFRQQREAQLAVGAPDGNPAREQREEQYRRQGTHRPVTAYPAAEVAGRGNWPGSDELALQEALKFISHFLS